MQIEVIGNVPKRQHEVDAGADLEAAEHVTIPVGKRALVRTGTRLNLPPGLVGFITPRSGLAHKHGVTVHNSPGTIDTGYTGEIMVNLVNLGDEDFEIAPGDRIAQIVIQPIQKTFFDLVPAFTQRWGERGEDGHGSTG